MLRKALNIKWQEHVTNKEVYGKLPLVSSKIKARRVKMAGHCVRHPELSVHPLINHDFLYLEMVPTEFYGNHLKVKQVVAAEE